MTQRKSENRRNAGKRQGRQAAGRKYGQYKNVTSVSELPPMPEEMREAIAFFIESLMEAEDADVLSVTEEECDAGSEDECIRLKVNGDERVVALYPNGLLTIMKSESCVDVFEWLRDTEVCEPVPGVKDVYMTYDSNKVVEQNGHKWVFSPLLFYRVEMPSNFKSLTDKDINLLVDAMDHSSRNLFDTASAEQLKCFCLD